MAAGQQQNNPGYCASTITSHSSRTCHKKVPRGYRTSCYTNPIHPKSSIPSRFARLISYGHLQIPFELFSTQKHHLPLIMQSGTFQWHLAHPDHSLPPRLSSFPHSNLPLPSSRVRDITRAKTKARARHVQALTPPTIPPSHCISRCRVRVKGRVQSGQAGSATKGVQLPRQPSSRAGQPARMWQCSHTRCHPTRWARSPAAQREGWREGGSRGCGTGWGRQPNIPVTDAGA